MKDQRKFSKIQNQFNLDEEEKNFRESHNNNKDIIHQSISSSNNNDSSKENNKKTKLSHTNTKKQRRDIFGYFMRYDNSNEESEQSSSSKIDNDKDNDDYYGKYNPNEEEDEKNENNSNIRNTLNSFEEKNKNQDNFYENLYENRENVDSLNNLSNSNNKNNDDNTKNSENDFFRLNSFRPKPRADSPKFKKSIKLNKINNNNEKENNINNDNSQNFAETLQTTIEGIQITENNSKNNKYNDKKFTHDNNIISLGKNMNKDNRDSDKKNNAIKNNIKINGDKIGKASEVRDDEDDEDGKENVIEDDEENEKAQIDYLNNIEEKRKKLKQYQDNIKYYQNADYNNKDIINTKTNNDILIKDMSVKLLQKYINGEEESITHDKNINIDKSLNVAFNNNSNLNNNDLNKNNNNNKTDSKSKSKYKITKKKYNNNKNKKNININIKKTPIEIKNDINDSPFIKNNNSYFNSTIKSNYSSNNNKNNKLNYSISSFKIKINTHKKKMKINYELKDRVYDKQYIKKKINKTKINSISPIKFRKKKLKKRKNNPLLYTPIKPRPKKIKDYHENYTFTPIINRKSQIIWEKRNKNLEIEMNKTPSKNNSSIRKKKLFSSIGVLLYNYANNKNEKMKEKCLTEKNKYKLIANEKKMSKNSSNLVIERINKKLKKIIDKYSINEKVSIVNTIQCLSDLNIINELIKSNQISDLNIEKIKDNIIYINEKDWKKKQELEFVEQLWFLVNPTMEEYINKKLFFELLKVLFSPKDNDINNYQIKELSKCIQNLIDKYYINNIDEEKEKEKSNSEPSMISPLTNQKIEKNSQWPISKIIKTFLQLKSNIKAYRNNEYDYKRKEISNTLKKEREKELKFEPDLSQSSDYIFKNNSKYNYYIDYHKPMANDIYFYSFNNKKRKLDFNKIYERFMVQQKMHEEAVEKLREIKRKKELKKCSNKPKISDYSPENLNLSVNYENSKIFNRRNDNVPIFERLYTAGTISHKNKIKKRNNLTTDKKNTGDKNGKKMNKSINFLNHYPNEDNNINTNTNNTNKGKNNRNNNIIDNIYVIIEIKKPNGEIKPLKIYKNENNKDNVRDILNEFCKENDLNEEDKNILLKKIIDYKNAIFGNNINEENNFNINDDMDIMNHSNQSNEDKESNKKYNNENEEKIYNIIDKEEINIEDKKLKNLEDYITYKNKDVIKK